ncbi:hypothetical protein PR048_017583 [Dryococelus australis]|uniref:Uncharacterized protein n=1 Tax=Dryococelus australis TaxID=614101 RepID=A0ABQ9HA62_9NEOP|nr:hypothetical protein PR048_017583 [Dryococelus australis]
MKRQPCLSFRASEGCSVARIMGFNRHNVGMFFENMKLLSLSTLSLVTRDKYGIPMRQNSNKPADFASNCSKRHQTITTALIINAAGNTIPPAMVFPRLHLKNHMIQGALSGTLGLAHPTGWMTSSDFIHVIEHLIEYSGCSITCQMFLICDNHEMLTFSIYNVAFCVGIVHARAMVPQSILNTFRKTGIYPKDKEVYTDDMFLASSVNEKTPEMMRRKQSNVTRLASAMLQSSLILEPTLNTETPVEASISGTSNYIENHVTASNSCRPTNYVSPRQFSGYPKKAELLREKEERIQKRESEMEEKEKSQKITKETKNKSTKRKIAFEESDEEIEDEWNYDEKIVNECDNGDLVIFPSLGNLKDIGSVPFTDVRIFPAPSESGKTKRQQSLLSFAV